VTPVVNTATMAFRQKARLMEYFVQSVVEFFSTKVDFIVRLV